MTAPTQLGDDFGIGEAAAFLHDWAVGVVRGFRANERLVHQHLSTDEVLAIRDVANDQHPALSRADLGRLIKQLDIEPTLAGDSSVGQKVQRLVATKVWSTAPASGSTHTHAHTHTSRFGANIRGSARWVDWGWDYVLCWSCLWPIMRYLGVWGSCAGQAGVLGACGVLKECFACRSILSLFC